MKLVCKNLSRIKFSFIISIWWKTIR